MAADTFTFDAGIYSATYAAPPKRHYTHFSLWLEGLPLETPLDMQPAVSWAHNYIPWTGDIPPIPFGGAQVIADPQVQTVGNQVWFVTNPQVQAQYNAFQAHRNEQLQFQQDGNAVFQHLANQQQQMDLQAQANPVQADAEAWAMAMRRQYVDVRATLAARQTERPTRRRTLRNIIANW